MSSFDEDDELHDLSESYHQQVLDVTPIPVDRRSPRELGDVELSKHRAKLQRYAEMLNIEIRPEASEVPPATDRYEAASEETTPPDFSPSQFKRKLEEISTSFKKHLDKPMKSALDQIDSLTKQFAEEGEVMPEVRKSKPIDEASFDWRKRLEDIKRRSVAGKTTSTKKSGSLKGGELDIKSILLKYGNENLLNEFPSSSNDQASSSFNDRDDGEDSFLEVQRRIKEKYRNQRSPSPQEEASYSPTKTLSSRYEQLTGRSPSADILTSSLDELLKSLKTKFGPKREEAQPFDTI